MRILLDESVSVGVRRPDPSPPALGMEAEDRHIPSPVSTGHLPPDELVGALVAEKSGTSLPTHLPRMGFPEASLVPLSAVASHQMTFLLSDHGVPSGLAEARL